MTTKRLLIYLVICSVAVTATADPMRYPYWQMVKDVVSNVEMQPPRPLSISETGNKTDIEYPFEMLRHLRTTDLLRAAAEGAQEARLQAALGKSKEEIESLVLANVTLALEYLPMLIRSDSDIEEITKMLANREEDKILRLYLLQNSFPGFAVPSFQSMSLPEIMPDNDAAFSESLLQISTHPTEDPILQSLALRIWHAWLLQHYERVLAADPSVAKLMAASTTSDTIINCAKNAQIVFSEDTVAELKKCRNMFNDFALAISGHICEDSVRDDGVKKVTRQILEEMRDSIIGINMEIITAALEGKQAPFNPFTQLPPGDSTSIPVKDLNSEKINELLKL